MRLVKQKVMMIEKIDLFRLTAYKTRNETEMTLQNVDLYVPVSIWGDTAAQHKVHHRIDALFLTACTKENIRKLNTFVDWLEGKDTNQFVATTGVGYGVLATKRNTIRHEAIWSLPNLFSPNGD
jgi:hypothetical protein